MKYLEKLQTIQQLRDDLEKINQIVHAFGYSVNEQIYSLGLLTHVTEMDETENLHYHTTLIIGDDQDEKIHTLMAFVKTMHKSGLLQLLKKLIEDYERQQESDI